jgi:polyisoprenyl-phosphate glycosyltransferase
VLPAFNEEPNVAHVHDAVVANLSPVASTFEIIFVDDGSTDGTADAVRRLQEKHSHVRLLRLTRNFGHQAALLAGIEAAAGRAIVTMDCDLQHPPELLPQMIEAWREGAFVVQTVRSYGPEISWPKRGLSRLFYWLTNLVGGVRVEPAAADFRLLDRRVADGLLSINDVKPFIRGTLAWLGYRTTFLPFRAGSRHAGEPSYRLSASARLAFNAIFLLSAAPLRAALILGLFSATLCLIYFAYALGMHFLGKPLPGWASLILSVLFIGSVQLTVLGLIAEYIGQIFDRARKLPVYVRYPEEDAAPPAAVTSPSRDG